MTDNTPDQPQSGAIRMMAFGVFEAARSRQSASLTKLRLRASVQYQNASPRLEQEDLVFAEFKAHGWALKIDATRGGKAFILLGRAEVQPGGWHTRPILGRGSLQEVCQKAVDWLDGNTPAGSVRLDWTLVPTTEGE